MRVLEMFFAPFTHSMLLFLRTAWRYALADLGGGVPGACPPYGTQFFHFRIHFHRKVPTSEVHAPPNGCTPPYGKSWICIEFCTKQIILVTKIPDIKCHVPKKVNTVAISYFLNLQNLCLLNTTFITLHCHKTVWCNG